MKAFPRSNKCTLCLPGLVPAVELGGCLSLGDPCGAALCDAPARAQSRACSPAGHPRALQPSTESLETAGALWGQKSWL